MNHDETVPKTTPNVITRAKLKIDAPPKDKSATRTKRVVPDVIVVRLSVAFNARLTVVVMAL